MTTSDVLTPAQRRHLADLARQAVNAAVQGAPPPASSAALPEVAGVFVTVRVAGDLRGCLGTLQPPPDLAGEVARCAAEAATRDPRFPPLTAGDLPALGIEVSVLGPFEPIDPPSPAAVAIGRHGLFVERGRRRGLLLPQVAVEWGWDGEEFLRHACLKAGLPADAWRRGASVSRFEADVFGD